MSRARPIAGQWFDMKKNGQVPKVAHLELLAAAENISVDDLLDEGVTQGELILRLRGALGEGLIPAEVLERHRRYKEEASRQPRCRICDAFGWECEGSITRHHFIPRWLMLQLENYVAYAARTKCTVPICVSKHRDLHILGSDTPKEIISYLTDDERKFAHKMLSELKEQHPKIFELLLGGDEEVSYEAKLVSSYIKGEFLHQDEFASKTDANRCATTL